MARMVLRDGTPPLPVDVVTAGVVTVADLLSRHAAAMAPPGGSGPMVSVDSLLRREGGAPHAVDRPARPRRSEPAAAEPARRGPVLRRGAVVAGALAVAGAAIGATSLIDAASSGVQDAQDVYPGQSRPGGLPVGAPQDELLDPITVTAALDPGTAAPASWMTVAFPTTTGGVPSGSDTDSPAGSGSPSVRDTPTGRPTTSPTPGAVPSPAGGSGGPDTATNEDSDRDGPGDVVTGTSDGLADIVDSVEEILPETPLRKPVHAVTDTVRGAGTVLGDTVNAVTAPLAAGLLG